MSKWLVSLILASASSICVAATDGLTLAPIGDPVNPPITVGTNPAPIPCDQIVDRLVAYTTNAGNENTAVNTFLQQVSDKMNAWYALLQPLENAPQTIQAGTFLPIQDGAAKIDTINGYAFDNTKLLNQEIETITSSLRACLAAKK